jgi:hypothetical protein
LRPGGATNAPPAFDEIVDAISSQRPLPVRIDWNGSDGHFVCVTGYAIDGDGGERVTVHDPFVPGVGQGPVEDQDMPFEAFLTAYASQAGNDGTPNFKYEVQ